MNEIEVAWLAGLLEGEGFFSAVQREGVEHFTMTVGINMTDLDVLEKAQRITGLGHITSRPREKSHHKDQWSWRVTTDVGVREILRLIEPHMGERRSLKINAMLASPSPRVSRPQRATDTHCANGHPWTEETVYVDPRGRKGCRMCNRGAVARSKARRVGVGRES